MTHTTCNPIVIADVMSLVTSEIQSATSERDLKSRLANLGYGYKDTPSGRKLTTLPHGIEIGALPFQARAVPLAP